MTPEHHERVGRLFRDALELPAGERSSFLSRSCDGDAALQSEVESLLSYEAVGRAAIDGSAMEAVGRTMAVEQSHSWVGRQVSHYRVLSRLGGGGMGEVYRARDTRLGRDVAIKALPLAFAADSARMRRFGEEARTIGQLNHPNIVVVHDIGVHDGAPFIVTEMLEGEDLRQRLNHGPLTLRRAVDYAQQIARGLAATHARGIVHRDLKPENLLVTREGCVKILDFGLAKLTDAIDGKPPVSAGRLETSPGFIVGTIGYLAPEQLRGECADHRADVFAFGVILHEMLSGRRPFERASPSEVVAAILKDEPPDPGGDTGLITLNRIVRRCLEKEPEQRFQSSRDLAFALDTLSPTSTESAGVHAPPFTLLRPAGKARYRLIHAFGSFRLDPAERLLLRNDQPVSLTPKAFDLLTYLVDRRGRLVTKQELLTAIWPDTFVEESNLAYTVSALRRALGDGMNGEHFIQTVPTLGYRFVAPVTQIEPRKPTDGAVSVTHRRAAILAAVLLTLITAMLVVSHVRAPGDTADVSRFALPLSGPGIVRVSPDGRRIAFVPAAFVIRPTDASVWLRDIDAPVTQEAQRIEGTQGALWLFWAPDSQQLAFVTASALKKLSLSDGTIQTLCDPCQPAGEGTWSRAGLIVLPEEEGSLFAISVDGGTPQPVTTVDRAGGEIRHTSPYFLPDGRRFLYVIRNEDPSRSGVYVGDLTSGTPKRLLDGDTPAVFAPPGYLLFWRAGTLMAQPFDDRRLALAGEARTLIPESRFIRFWPPRHAASISDRGMLMYSVAEEPESQFRWVSRTGALQRAVEEPARYYTFALSADGERLVFSQVETGRRDYVWEVNLNSGRRLLRTFGDWSYVDPRWMDARQLLAMRWPEVRIVRIDRDGKESAITAPPGCVLDDVSRDGRHLLCRTGPGRRELHAVRLEGESGASTLVRAAPAGIIDQTRFSPDGQWIAYNANESGRLEVYVAPFASNAEAWPVSTGGGVQPYWGDDGRELYYLDLQGALHAVEWRPEREPPFSDPVRLFETGIIAPSAVVEQYAASPGGDRFLILKPVDDKVRHTIQVVINWPALLQHAR